MEPYEKVLVSEEFLSTVHGEIGCENCHQGNPQASAKEEAHQGLVAMPSEKAPVETCGECHPDISRSAQESLHFTLKTFPKVLKQRADMEKWEAVDQGRQNHCAACHTSCGGCHVSRPQFAKKGFVNGHLFQKHSDPLNQCTACHGSRVGNEFYGSRGQGDLHAAEFNMDCVSCHGADEMHAAAPENITSRFELPEMPACTQCHQDLQYGSVRDHTIHIGKVQCQVCHSQSYVNCYACHTGKDKEGIAYFATEGEVETFKIGRNYLKDAPNADYDYMVVRHVPVDRELFEYYTEDALTNFAELPTWKRAAPHNIRRETWQTASCNHCHGNRELFLAKSDLRDYEVKANEPVVVADEDVPKKIEKTRTVTIPTEQVRQDMVVDASWLHDNLKTVKIVDARSEADYGAGHIPGAVGLDIFTAGLRYGPDEQRALQVVEPEKLHQILADRGLTAEDRIVVYDEDGRRAGFLLWVLEYAGAKQVTYLNGGVKAWERAGYHLSKERPAIKARPFKGEAQPKFIVDNAYVRENLDNPRVVIIDARIIPQVKGMTKSPEARRAGHIPGSINLPVGALYMENGDLKPPEQLLWMLSTYGITPEKTIITTCNTGQLAGDSFFIFRYLGFPDVRVHDESWLSWCRIE